ncbi:prostaglandin F2-alpha receptor [Scleropages formosus]|nr:prostaglandin F2-alpha receptor [Scleropages formosus]
MLSNGSSMENCMVPSSTNVTCRRIELSAMISVFTMTVGMLSNTLALLILIKAYRRFRLKSKASFLLFASSLVATNFLGHLINGSLALYVYSLCMDWRAIDPRGILCGFFGASMVFFGLSALLLGSGMAVERCLGVTQPLFHSVVLTSCHAKRLLGFLWLLAALVALMPVVTRRPYRVQYSRSWCFYDEGRAKDWLDLFLPLLFSSVGLLALLVSILCNTVTGATLLRSKLLGQRCSKVHTAYHQEMICQLLAIMLVSCICWGPILVNVVVRSAGARGLQDCGHMLLAVRMATWNQILDPWVYILLRKAVLRKLFRVARRCCSPLFPSLYKWDRSTVKGSVRSSTCRSSAPRRQPPGEQRTARPPATC